MAYVKIIYQNSPSTATPINAENLNHMDDQIALNDQRLTELEGTHVSSFNGRTGAVTPADGDYDIGQIAPLTGAQVGQVPVVVNHGTEQDPELVFEMGAGGGGGHSIIDSEGNTMPQESAMQFPDSFVSDDDVNGRTVVENIKEHDTKADYDNATEDGFHVVDDGEDAVIHPSSEDYVEASVPTGQTWTWQTLLNDLYSRIDRDKINLGNVTLWEINDYWSMCHHLERMNDSILFFSRELNTSDLSGTTFQLNSSASKKFDFNISSGNTFTDNSSSNVSSGTVVRLYYGNKKATVDLQTTANRCLLTDGETTVADVVDCDKTTAGTYALKCTVDAQGNKTYSWV